MSLRCSHFCVRLFHLWRNLCTKLYLGWNELNYSRHSLAIPSSKTLELKSLHTISTGLFFLDYGCLMIKYLMMEFLKMVEKLKLMASLLLLSIITKQKFILPDDLFKLNWSIRNFIVFSTRGKHCLFYLCPLKWSSYHMFANCDIWYIGL